MNLQYMLTWDMPWRFLNLSIHPVLALKVDYSPFICFSACACTIEPEIGTPSALACTGVAQNQVVCLQRVFLISPASSSKSWTRLRSHCLECRDTTSPLGNDVDAKLWCINVSTTSSAGKYCLLLILLFIDKRLVNFSLSSKFFSVSLHLIF